MATFTSRLNLRKPSSETSPGAGDGDLTNWETDLNENWDKIDEAMGFAECTSSTRPSVVWAGLCIYETDTDKTYVSNGTSPASASWIQIPNGNTTIDTSEVNLTGASSATDTVLISTVDAEDFDRFVVDADGTFWWGNGQEAVDTRLYRTAGNTLTAPGRMYAAEGFDTTSATFTGTFDETTLEESNHIRVVLGAEEDNRAQLSSVGRWSLGEGDSPVDADLYRNLDTNLVGIGGDFIISGSLTPNGIGQVRFVQKTSNTSRSTTAMSDDPHLSLPVDANATYEVEMWLAMRQSGDHGVNTTWAAPSGADGYKSALGATNVDAGHNSLSDTNVRTGIHFFSTACEYETETSGQWAYERGILVMGPSAGTITLQWAKKTTVTGDATLEQYSYMKVTRTA